MSLSKFTLAVFTAASLILGNVGVAFSHEGEDHSKQKTQHKLSAQGKRVVTILEKFVAAIESGDLSEVEKYVVRGDGFSSLDGTYEDLGWASFRQHLASDLPMLKDATFELSNIRPYVKGKMAYATMDYTESVTIKSNKVESGKRRLKIKGKATIILVQLNKEWKIRHLHTVQAKVKEPESEKKTH